MEQYNFSNNNIELTCEKVSNFLASVDVEHREVLRIKLTFEEVLLKYREKLGEDASFNVKFVKWLSYIKIEMIVQGESYDVFGMDDEEDDIIRGLDRKSVV